MIKQQLGRAKLFAAFAEKPILCVEDLFGDDVNYWFVCNDFVESNPSGHIHFNELRSGICINDLMSLPQEFDKVMFLTKLTEIERSSFTFHAAIKWVKIK